MKEKFSKKMEIMNNNQAEMLENKISISQTQSICIWVYLWVALLADKIKQKN
jgi:hypothetical protein